MRFSSSARLHSVSARHDQPFGNRHVTDVTGELDTLDTFLGINGRRVGRLHAGDLAEQGQQGPRELLQCSGFGDGFRENQKVSDPFWRAGGKGGLSIVDQLAAFSQIRTA
jgi:hypothetical protein